MKRERIDAYFWFELGRDRYCVVAIDPKRRERKGRRSVIWCREWFSDSIRGLRDVARLDGRGVGFPVVDEECEFDLDKRGNK